MAGWGAPIAVLQASNWRQRAAGAFRRGLLAYYIRAPAVAYPSEREREQGRERGLEWERERGRLHARRSSCVKL